MIHNPHTEAPRSDPDAHAHYVPDGSGQRSLPAYQHPLHDRSPVSSADLSTVLRSPSVLPPAADC